MDLQELSVELIAAKQIEAEAISNRVAIEKKMLNLIAANACSQFRQSTDISFSVDAVDLMMATMSWPAEIQPAYLSPYVDMDRLKMIMSDHPELWQMISHLVNVQNNKVDTNFLAA